MKFNKTTGIVPTTAIANITKLLGTQGKSVAKCNLVSVRLGCEIAGTWKYYRLKLAKTVC